MTIRLLIVLPLVWMLSSCLGTTLTSSSNDKVVECGSRVPSFSVVLNDGTEFNSIRQVKPFVIAFFNTSCIDCQKELPLLQTLANSFIDSLNVICVSRAEENEPIQRFWENEQLTLRFSAQTDKFVFSLFANRTIPRLYFVDGNGIIRFQFSQKVSLRQLKHAANELLKNAS